ncbi:MAG TPA: transporter [Syntrophales bacterium]
MKSIRAIFFIIIVTHAFLTLSHAAHPLITDDTGTQGKGKFLFELNGQTDYETERSGAETGANASAKSRETEIKAAFTCGVIDNVDVILTLPYQWKKSEGSDATAPDVSGIADISVEIKWRFFEKDGLSFAIKPGITLPAGDKDKDLGTGRATGTLYFIATKEIDPWAFHLNLGYKRNEDTVDEREDIWHASLAGEYKVMKNLKLVANIGAERNTDKASDTNPAYILGGFIYSIRENMDIDFGVKGGLNRAEADIAYLAGIALRF